MLLFEVLTQVGKVYIMVTILDTDIFWAVVIALWPHVAGSGPASQAAPLTPTCNCMPHTQGSSFYEKKVMKVLELENTWILYSDLALMVRERKEGILKLSFNACYLRNSSAFKENLLLTEGAYSLFC